MRDVQLRGRRQSEQPLSVAAVVYADLVGKIRPGQFRGPHHVVDELADLVDAAAEALVGLLVQNVGIMLLDEGHAAS